MQPRDIIVVAAVVAFTAFVVVKKPFNMHERQVLLRTNSTINNIIVVTDEGDNIREMRFCEPPCMRQARIKVHKTFKQLEST
jgi:hypothetical protein